MKSVAMIKRNFIGFTGAIRTFSEHIRSFKRLGYQVDIYAANVDAALVNQFGVASRQIGFWPLNGHRGRAYFNWRVAGLIDAMKYDLIIGHGDVIAQDVLFLHNCRHLAYESINGTTLPESDSVGKIHRKIFEADKFRLVLVHSNLVKKDIHRRFSVPEDKIEVTYPGYHPEDFPANSGARDRVRNDLGVRADDILVGLITSGCNKKRNIGLFLRAAAEAAGKSSRSIKILMLGKRASSKEHRKLAAEAGLNSAILLEPVKNVGDYYQALDVYVLPAHLEEFGRVVLEAMVYGLPVVVSDRVGASEILEGVSREGIFVAGNQELLVDRICRIADDMDYALKMGEQNRITARKYSETKQVRQLVEVLIKHDLISSPAGLPDVIR